METVNINYSAVGDILAMVVTIVNWVLLGSSYSVKKYSLTLFKVANLVLMVAAASSIAFHKLLGNITEATDQWVYISRVLNYGLLIVMFDVFLIYVLTLIGSAELNRKKASMHFVVVTIIVFALLIVGPIVKFGFYIDSNYVAHMNEFQDAFVYAYLFYLVFFIYLMIRYRKKFITSMYYCLISVVAISFLVMIIQEVFHQRSFTVFTFTLPVIAVLFLYHHNAFDQDTGTLDDKAFDGYIHELGKKDFTIVYLRLKEAHPEKMEELTEVFYHFNESYFKKPVTFRKGQQRMILVYRRDENPDSGTKLVQLLNDFNLLYKKHQMEYKIVILNRVDALKTGDDYFNMLDFLENGQEWNTVYQSKESDVEALTRSMNILMQLKDIQQKGDLNDERVLVFCQPVLQVSDHSFTTAEALMRLKLPDYGMVYPDQFIPIAERFDYIHTLSLIILNKTCKAIHDFIEHGYEVERISVNFSIEELKNSSFCEDVLSIVERNHIPFSKIALELTESRDLESFEMVLKSMETLHKYGIHFYLDDFGTGYSNFERILGLPVDIIKFDRSLTIKSADDVISNYMVGSFATIFKKADYQVLFEGIESEKDEKRCVEMQADYLQGYRYSKPIPIEELTGYFAKKKL